MRSEVGGLTWSQFPTTRRIQLAIRLLAVSTQVQRGWGGSLGAILQPRGAVRRQLLARLLQVGLDLGVAEDADPALVTMNSCEFVNREYYVARRALPGNQ